MSDSLPLVKVEAGVWTDLYSESGLAVGSEVVINIVVGSPSKIAFKATTPTNEVAGLLKIGEWYKVGAGESGLWVYSARGCHIAVQGV